MLTFFKFECYLTKYIFIINMKTFFKFIKIPIEIVTSGSPATFVFRRRNKLYKIIYNPTTKGLAVDLWSNGKKSILIGAFVFTVISSRRFENEETIQESYYLSQNNTIERLNVRGGAAVDNVWNPKAKYQSSRSSKSMSSRSKHKNNVRRRLFSVNEKNFPIKSRSRVQYSGSHSLNGKTYYVKNNNNDPKTGRGIKVRSISMTNDNNEEEVIRFDNETNLNDNYENKLEDLDSSVDNNINQNSTKEELNQTSTEIESNQTSKVKNVGLKKAREKINVIKNDGNRITPEGDFVSPSQVKLTSEGRKYVDRTKLRRANPLVQSNFEDEEIRFYPAYSLNQSDVKYDHTKKFLELIGKDVEQFESLPKIEQRKIAIDIVEKLLENPGTEIYSNAMGQGREPIFLALNRGTEGYPVEHHAASFERRPEIWKYNSYISNYILKSNQVTRFDNSVNTTIDYKDLMGNSITNTGPIFGKDKSINSLSKDNSSIVNEGKTKVQTVVIDASPKPGVNMIESEIPTIIVDESPAPGYLIDQSSAPGNIKDESPAPRNIMDESKNDSPVADDDNVNIFEL